MAERSQPTGTVDDFLRGLLQELAKDELEGISDRFAQTIERSLVTVARQVLSSASKASDCGASAPTALSPVAGLNAVPVVNTGSGVYFLVAGDDVVYVGQSVNAGARIHAHLETKLFDRAFYLPVERDQLDEVEGAFIRHLRPRLNGNPGPSGFPAQDQRTLARYGITAVPEVFDQRPLRAVKGR